MSAAAYRSTRARASAALESKWWKKAPLEVPDFGGGSVNAMALPQLRGRAMVTDGGMETDLIFHHGVDLPCFAAFPLLESARGRELLAGYYHGYAAIARRAGAGLVLDSPTWRANPDWGGRLGYSP